MLRQISILSLIGFSLVLGGCPSKTVTLDTLCQARLVRVSQEVKEDLRRWVDDQGRIRATAPKGGGQFLKDISVNNELIRTRCGG